MDIEDTRKLESLTAEELEHVSLGLMKSFGFSVARLASSELTMWLMISSENVGMALPGDFTMLEVWKAAEIFEEGQDEQP